MTGKRKAPTGQETRRRRPFVSYGTDDGWETCWIELADGDKVTRSEKYPSLVAAKEAYQASLKEAAATRKKPRRLAPGS